MMNLKILLLLIIAEATTAAAPGAPSREFLSFLENEAVFYPQAEMKMRLGLYKSSQDHVTLHNANPARTWDMGLNMFSTMTEEEKQQYLGLANETMLEEDEPRTLSHAVTSLPSSIDHVARGIITPVKNQGGCGSCWAFAATASYEGVYADVTGYRKTFAEQESLDCSYDDVEYNACKGGWMNKAWEYISRSKRLAISRDVSYTAVDGPCSYTSIHNGIQNIVPEKYTRVGNGDAALQEAVYKSVPAVAIIVESDFFSYSRGIYNGCPNDKKSIAHAVTVVGYDSSAWKVRNSWGSGWGEGGYIRMSRSKSNICRISEFAMYPNLTKMSGLFVIRNSVTGRYLSCRDNLDDVRGRRGEADGWSYGSTLAYAEDANYYEHALWRLVDIGGGEFWIEHFQSGRFLFDTGKWVDPSRRNGDEGGWSHTNQLLVTDANYYNKANWKLNKDTTSAQFITSSATNRYLFAAGSNVKGKDASGSYGNEKVRSVDANYYGYAAWEVTPYN